MAVGSGAELCDLNGLPVTARSAEAVRHFDEGLLRWHALDGGIVEAFERAVAADPGFAVAHAALALRHLLSGSPATAREPAARSAALAAALGDHLTARERGNVAVADLAVRGERLRALEAARAHVAAYPRDELVVRLAGILISQGGAPDRQEQSLALYAGVAPHYPDEPWLLGQRAFLLTELGRFAEARPLVERALARDSRGGWLAHCVAHLCFESGDHGRGAAFLRERLPGSDPEGGYYGHNWWHLAVFQLSLGRFRAALATYEHGVSPLVVRQRTTLTDAVGFLWRCQLFGYAARAPLPWRAVLDYVEERLRPGAVAGGSLIHALVWANAAVAFVAAGDDAAFDNLVEGLRRADPATDPVPGEVVLPLALGMRAFARGDHEAAADLLGAVAGGLVRIGGSNEQRSIFEDTLLEAQLRAGRHAEVEAHLRRRLAQRTTARDLFWLGRAQAGSGQAAAAGASLDRALELWAEADSDSPEVAEAKRLAGMVRHGVLPDPVQVTRGAVSGRPRLRR